MEKAHVSVYDTLVSDLGHTTASKRRKLITNSGSEILVEA